MRRLAIAFCAILAAVCAVPAHAQTTDSVSPSNPAAVPSQADCSGFYSEASLGNELSVVGGEDDDFQSAVRQFVQGESIYIVSSHKRPEAVEADEYIVLRPATELFQTSHYEGQEKEMRQLGLLYQDIAKVQVTHRTAHGAVAKIVFSCEAVVPGDILVPFQPRGIPTYTVNKPLDAFAPLDKHKVHGRISASHNNTGYFGRETIVYIDFGEAQGTLPGRRLRIYKLTSSDTKEAKDLKSGQESIPETVGEAIVLSVATKSSVAIIVSSSREIDAGDYVELE